MRSHEELGGARRNQEQPGGARMSQGEKPGGGGGRTVGWRKLRSFIMYNIIMS